MSRRRDARDLADIALFPLRYPAASLVCAGTADDVTFLFLQGY